MIDPEKVIHSFTQQLSECHRPGSTHGSRSALVNKRDKNMSPHKIDTFRRWKRERR